MDPPGARNNLYAWKALLYRRADIVDEETVMEALLIPDRSAHDGQYTALTAVAQMPPLPFDQRLREAFAGRATSVEAFPPEKG